MSNTCNNIDSQGIVVKVDDEKVEIMIQSNSACGACLAKNMCGMTENKPKYIVIKKKNGGNQGTSLYDRNITVGDIVTVGLSVNTGMRAARIAYLYPFVLFIAVLLILISILNNELFATAIAIGVLALYYLILWLFNKIIRKNVRFYLI